MKKKLLHTVSVIATMSLLIVSLSGCGKTDSGVNEASKNNNSTNTTVESTTENENDIEVIEVSSSGTKLLASLKDTYASSSLNEDYNTPLYNLPSNHVFTFECSDAAGAYAYKAFKVYDNTEYKDLIGKEFNKNTYSDGKITVEPNSVIKLSEGGSFDISDGTWGSLNQLYLVQFIDLNTGLDLEKPIVTPFTIQHELKAPTLSQSVDTKNNYTLTWTEVPGAAKYVVFEYSNDVLYDIVAMTTDTSINVNEFIEQKKDNNYDALIKQDLLDAGYTVDTEGITHMNSAVKYNADLNDCHFVVIAISEDGDKTSGISNIVDVRDISHKLPYVVGSSVVDVTISSVMEIPTYVEVEMIDGSYTQMIIDYHGAQTYKYSDDDMKMGIKAHVANTEFDSFYIVIHGMTYEDIMQDIGYVTSRQDKLLDKISGIEAPDVIVEVDEDVNNEEIMKIIEQLPEDVEDTETEVITETTEPEVTETVENEPEVTETVENEPEVTETVETEIPTETSDEASLNLPMQLTVEVANTVDKRLNEIGLDKVDKILYSTSDLEAWMSYCLIAQSEIIPVPIEMFPEAANVEYVAELFTEAFRQNPTCGLVSDVLYNSEYQALAVKYVEDPELRFSKTIEEINTACRLADEITNDSMSDYEKVLAINEYFRTNASYDYDSAETDVDLTTLSEAFLDAHAPIGILCNNYGVCESYSEAFVLTARVAGLNALCETGTMYGGGHEWNRVQVDGKWCILDITNNDTDEVINALFNVTDSQVNGILVSDKSAIFNDDTVSAFDNTKEYYYVNGKATDNMQNATSMLVEQLKSNNKAILRIPSNASESDCQAIVTSVVQDYNITLTDAYSQFGVLYLSK